MISSLSKKFITFFITAVILVNPHTLLAQESTSSGFIDESLQDLTIVLGSGAAGAVLGLSTLSFVDEPKDHLKNIAIGGAIGVVIGVGIVIFGQATKSSSSIVSTGPKEITPGTSESLARVEFSKQKIADSYKLPETIGYNFTF